jgi:thymidylate synthase ThyX
MVRKTSDLKVTFLGITPILDDSTGILSPQDIVSLSALLTFKGKSVKDLRTQALERGENLEEKVKKILMNSSLRGHASIATTPVLSFSFESSKFLDLMLTGIVFASGLMASGRRTDTTDEDIVFPTSINQSRKAKKIYSETSKKNIDFFNFLVKQEVGKDETRKILQYGIYGTGTIALPIESIIGFKKEYEAEREWMPEEAGILIGEIEKNLKKFGVDFLYFTRMVAPRDTYPYPNVFKDPGQPNLARDLAKKYLKNDLTEVVEFNHQISPSLKKQLKNLLGKQKRIAKLKSLIKEHWYELLKLRRQINRDYNLSLNFKVASSVAWGVWTEKKRHRTCFMIADSIYYAVNRALQFFKQNQKLIEKGQINSAFEKKANRLVSIPPTIAKNKEFLQKWLLRWLDSLLTYERLLNFKIKPKDAIFIIPRGLRLEVVQEFNLYNLLSGYYPLRLCTTADEQILGLTELEARQLRRIFEKNKASILSEFLAPKCHSVCFCPEQKFCAKIKTLVSNYNDGFHQKMKVELESRFQKLKRNT